MRIIMDEQLALFDVSATKTQVTISEKKKRNWENGFQRWSDNQSSQSGGKSFGCCGWGSMCDYCEDNSYGRPCVRALNEMCREKGIFIDYDNRNYEDIWNGNFECCHCKTRSLVMAGNPEQAAYMTFGHAVYHMEG